MMFTPQKKVLSGWLSPRDDKNNSNPKDKGFAIGDSTPKGLVSNVGIMDQDGVIDRINKLEKEVSNNLLVTVIVLEFVDFGFCFLLVS